MRLFFSLMCWALLASPAFAQVTLSLDGGKSFTIDGQQTYQKDKYGNTHYARLSPDTLYCFEYNETNKVLNEARIPLSFFDKANTKKYGGKMRVLSGRAYLNTMLSIKVCDKDQYLYKGFSNRYTVLQHGTKAGNKPSDYSYSLYFDTKEAAEAFLEKIQAYVKALK